MKVGVAGRIATSSGMSLRPLICANENVFLEFCHGNFPELFLSRTYYKRPTCYYFCRACSLYTQGDSRLSAELQSVSSLFGYCFFPGSKRAKEKAHRREVCATRIRVASNFM